METPAGDLSGGNQQKVSLARWLFTDPEVLILDEPTQGIDVGAKSEIYHLIAELAAKGLAILLISSELPEVLGMSDRVIVMHAGCTVGEFDRTEADAQKCFLSLSDIRYRRKHDGAHTPGVCRGHHSRHLSCFIALAAPSFYSIPNLRDMPLANLPVLLIASGMTLVWLLRRSIFRSAPCLRFAACCGGLFVKHGLAAGLLPLAGIVGGGGAGRN